ncbi:ferroxidase fet3 [Irineochytrium annulatum]|nr:ferroxidase fet3 [Irineochytrium annulatum]
MTAGLGLMAVGLCMALGKRMKDPVVDDVVMETEHRHRLRTVYWDVTYVTVNPDGLHERRAVGVNGRWPVDPVVVDSEDPVMVVVRNSVDEPISLHFHGMFQEHTVQYDGVAGVTQCPIPPGQNFTYSFSTPKQYGTYWIHGHNDGLYVDGLRAPFVVRNPKETNKYDEEYVISVSDWYHKEHKDIMRDFMSPLNPEGKEPVPNSALIGESHASTYRFKPGKTYRLRLVSFASLATSTVWIDGHDMRVIEIDGVDVVPYATDAVPVAPGQRYSVLVTARERGNGTDVNYAMHAALDAAMFDPERTPKDLDPVANATIVYVKDAPMFVPHTTEQPAAPLDDTLLTMLDPPVPLRREDVQRHVMLRVAFKIMDDKLNHGTFNDVAYVRPDVPSLMSMLTLDNVSVTDPAAYGPNTNAFVLRHMETVEVVIDNTDVDSHPFHLHGHVFQVIERNSDHNYDPANLTDPARLPPTIVRDTVVAPGNGYVVIRFVADNPGAWFFHCHIEWHLATGMAATFIEAPEMLKLGTMDPIFASQCEVQGIQVPEALRNAVKRGGFLLRAGEDGERASATRDNNGQANFTTTAIGMRARPLDDDWRRPCLVWQREQCVQLDLATEPDFASPRLELSSCRGTTATIRNPGISKNKVDQVLSTSTIVSAGPFRAGGEESCEDLDGNPDAVLAAEGTLTTAVSTESSGCYSRARDIHNIQIGYKVDLDQDTDEGYASASEAAEELPFLPAEIWLPIFLFASTSLGDLARFSTLTRATRETVWRPASKARLLLQYIYTPLTALRHLPLKDPDAPAVLTSLLIQGAQLFCNNHDHHACPIFSLLFSATNPNHALASILLAHPASKDQAALHSPSLHITAARHPTPEPLAMLLDLHSHPPLATLSDCLRQALKYDRPVQARLLISLGAMTDAWVRAWGRTTLAHVARNGDDGLCRAIVERGAGVTRSMVEDACSGGRELVLEVLWPKLRSEMVQKEDGERALRDFVAFCVGKAVNGGHVGVIKALGRLVVDGAVESGYCEALMLRAIDRGAVAVVAAVDALVGPVMTASNGGGDVGDGEEVQQGWKRDSGDAVALACADHNLDVLEFLVGRGWRVTEPAVRSVCGLKWVEGARCLAIACGVSVEGGVVRCAVQEDWRCWQKYQEIAEKALKSADDRAYCEDAADVSGQHEATNRGFGQRSLKARCSSNDQQDPLIGV